MKQAQEAGGNNTNYAVEVRYPTSEELREVKQWRNWDLLFDSLAVDAFWSLDALCPSLLKYWDGQDVSLEQ
jgi:hypothetical protein